MSKRREKKRHGKLPIPATAKRRTPRLAVVFLAVATLVAIGFWWWKTKPAGISPPAAGPTVTSAVSPTPTGNNSEFQKLKGRWRRPDGGYVVEIKSVADGGAMDAAYFNPNPIHVAKAQASQDGAATKVFIELRDVNYPGSTYTLTYEPGRDRLAGIYYQAVERQRYEVVFERIK